MTWGLAAGSAYRAQVFAFLSALSCCLKVPSDAAAWGPLCGCVPRGEAVSGAVLCRTQENRGVCYSRVCALLGLEVAVL